MKKPIDKRKSLFRRAWTITSQYIRERDKYVCFTCGKQTDKYTSDTGHFVHGKSTPIYFNEFNLHCQCKKCNLWLSGNQAVYLRNIQIKYGIEKGDWLLSHKFKIHKYKEKELEEIIEYYKIKYKEL